MPTYIIARQLTTSQVAYQYESPLAKRWFPDDAHPNVKCLNDFIYNQSFTRFVKNRNSPFTPASKHNNKLGTGTTINTIKRRINCCHNSWKQQPRNITPTTQQYLQQAFYKTPVVRFRIGKERKWTN
eukprot:gene1716-4837_t